MFITQFVIFQLVFPNSFLSLDNKTIMQKPLLKIASHLRDLPKILFVLSGINKEIL